MTRREFIKSAAVAGVAAYTAQGASAPAAAKKQEDAGTARFGEVVIPPEREGREKHVPHIEAPARVKTGEPFQITVTVGKEVPHPNTIGHHIKWIQVYAKEEGERPLVHVGTVDLGPTYADPKVTFRMMLKKSSTLYALEYCNVHGVWDNAIKVEVE